MAVRLRPSFKDFESLPKTYDPAYVEDGWEDWWESCGIFRPGPKFGDVDRLIWSGKGLVDLYDMADGELEALSEGLSGSSLLKRGDSGRQRDEFMICLPPPNVTGALHIGHAMMVTLQDILVRFHRMNTSVNYIPGTDHAGIATQAVLEKDLARRGLKRSEMTRIEFNAEVWKWTKEYQSVIFSQLRRMGASCDFSNTYFTLDESVNRAVVRAFNMLYKDGLIKRRYKVVNYSGRLRSVLSDLEVDDVEVRGRRRMDVDGGSYEFGVMYYVKYPVVRKDIVGFVAREDLYGKGGLRKLDCTFQAGGVLNMVEVGKNRSLSERLKELNVGAVVCEDGRTSDGVLVVEEYLLVGTTRPETILGDTALCVAKGYGDYLAVNPLTKEIIPIVADSGAIEEGKGSGVMKVTPAHDHADFALHEKYGLKIKIIMDERNRIVVDDPSLGEFNGMKRFDCRAKVVGFLKERGLLLCEESHEMTLPICSRTGDVIEQMLRYQWWMNCKEMANRVLESNIEIYPEEARKAWKNWLSNIRDWCISRQLWWGHRIPAYMVCKRSESSDGKEAHALQAEDGSGFLGWVVAETDDKAMEEALERFGNDIKVERDEDVLDTWFSSGMWTMVTQGWPDKVPKITSLIETGSDILFFWVARMAMLSIHFTGMIPFQRVYLHGIVRDKQGRKMSKSLGNVINPLSVICGGDKRVPHCGADALRFGLSAVVLNLKDVNLDMKRVEGYRRFCNKIWNAYKYLEIRRFEHGGNYCNDVETIDMVSKWIIYERNKCLVKMTLYLKQYGFMLANQAIYSFVYEFCDVLIELCKKIDLIDVAIPVFVDILIMLHPFMPFITEELYQRVMRTQEGDYPVSVSIAGWPKVIDYEGTEFSPILLTIKSVRCRVGKNSTIVVKDKKLVPLFSSLIRCKISVKDDLLDFEEENGVKFKIIDDGSSNDN